MAQVVWITGASSGLGLHTAQALARNGFTVVAGARSFGKGLKVVFLKEGVNCGIVVFRDVAVLPGGSLISAMGYDVIATPDEFLSRCPNVVEYPGNTLTVDLQTPAQTAVLSL